MNPITVLLADDHTIVRAGLRALLALEDDIEVVGEAVNGHQAVAFANKLANSDYPSLSYANVYPLTMLLRILVAQVAVLWLS